MSITDIQKMSNPERLRVMEALWEALSQESKELESPEWHRDVLAGRRQRIESGDATFLSLEEAKNRLLK